MSNKKYTVLLRAPIESRSGYGSWSRQLLLGLYSHPRINLYVESTNWGDCPNNAFEVEDSAANRKIKHLLTKQMPKVKPDIFMQCTIPNEAQRRGNVNILITAGVEADRISLEMVQKTSEMDIVYYISEWTRYIMASSCYDEYENNTKRLIRKLRIEKPSEVVNPVVDTDIFKQVVVTHTKFPEITTKKNFIFAGHWLQGNFGEDRKNVGSLIKLFCEVFKGNEEVGLILKTSGAMTSLIDKGQIEYKINTIKNEIVQNPEKKKLPKIYLVHGNLTQEEMRDLYNHKSIIAYVSLHHGEGWGMPIQEAMACNIPCILTAWSGNTDFMTKENCIPIPSTMAPVPGVLIDNRIWAEGSQWAVPDMNAAASALMWAYNNQAKAKVIGVKGGQTIRENYSLTNMEDKMYHLIDKLIKSIEDGESAEHPFEVL